jgi:methyl-accepting chemotaxis protein
MAHTGAQLAIKLKLRLTHKLVGLFLLFGVTPLLATILFFERTGVELEKKGASRFKSTALQITDKIDRNLFDRYHDAQAFASNDAVLDRKSWYKRDAAQNAVVRAMNRYVDLYDAYYLTVFVDTSGRVAAVNTKDSEGKSIDTAWIYDKSYADAAWFRAVSAGMFTTKQPAALPANTTVTGTFVEDVDVDPDVKTVFRNDGRVLGFSAPVRDAAGNVIGYWTNRVKLAIVTEIIRDAYGMRKAEGQGSTSFGLVDAKGKVIYAFDPMRGGESLQYDTLDVAYQDLRAGRDGFGLGATPGGNEVVAGYRKDCGALGFPGMNWGVIITMPRTEAAAAAIKQSRTMYAIFTASVIVTVIAGIFLARRAARPIVGMTRIAKRVAAGDVQQTVEYEASDETGDLAEALRGMVSYLQGTAAAVAALARGDLRFRVERRSDEDVLSANVLEARTNIERLSAEVQGLIGAARDGALEKRGDAAGLQGTYGEIVSGMNDVMTAFAAPVDEARRVVGLLASRDLTMRASGGYRGAYGAMMGSINQAVDNLEVTLADIAASADHVAVAAGEISSGNQSLSQAATEQASALEEVTSSLQEITSMSKRNAAGAQDARQMAEAAKLVADRGVAGVRQLSEAVRSIKAHADQTSKIVKTIDDIAFQTNLLSLNAAVEAARAGEAGKGFAVVAEEVRNLAMRSAEAAKTTAALIEESVKSSEQGVDLNKQVDAHFQDIAEKVRRVVEVMSEIAAASEVQSRGVSQINSSVDEMSRVVQHNAATTEQAAASAEELSAQSSAVQERVRAFRLRATNGSGARRSKGARKAPRAGGSATRLRSVPPARDAALDATGGDDLLF